MSWLQKCPTVVWLNVHENHFVCLCKMLNHANETKTNAASQQLLQHLSFVSSYVWRSTRDKTIMDLCNLNVGSGVYSSLQRSKATWSWASVVGLLPENRFSHRWRTDFSRRSHCENTHQHTQCSCSYPWGDFAKVDKSTSLIWKATTGKSQDMASPNQSVQSCHATVLRREGAPEASFTQPGAQILSTPQLNSDSVYTNAQPCRVWQVPGTATQYIQSVQCRSISLTFHANTTNHFPWNSITATSMLASSTFNKK